jgi:hypothetical protein
VHPKNKYYKIALETYLVLFSSKLLKANFWQIITVKDMSNDMSVFRTLSARVPYGQPVKHTSKGFTNLTQCIFKQGSILHGVHPFVKSANAVSFLRMR